MRDSARTNFHAGEAAIQNRLGVKDKMARISQHVVRGFMPQEHRTFFCSLPFAVMGVVDKHGHPQATLTAGNHGFITSPDDRTLAFQAHPFLTNELGLDFTENQKVGMLGIELSTRRRNRMNGVLGSVANDRFAIHVEHSFGNCPQYIQTRDINPVAIQSNTVTDGGKISRGAGLSNYALNIIQTADTFLSLRDRMYLILIREPGLTFPIAVAYRVLLLYLIQGVLFSPISAATVFSIRSAISPWIVASGCFS